MSGDGPAALKTWTAAFEKNNDPAHGLNAALMAYDLGQPAVRDKLLAQVVNLGRLYQVDYRASEDVIGLAALIQQIIAGPDVPFDEQAFAKLLEMSPPEGPTALHYFAGRFLLRQGRTAESHKHLMQAATSPRHTLSRTLAAALLHEQHVEIGEVRDTE
jgi:hypothetical protein